MAIIFPCIVSLRGESTSTDKPAQPQLAGRAAVTEVLLQTFKYDPSIRKKAAEEGVLDEDVIRLDPFLVTEKKVSPFLLSDMDRKRALFEANKPSLSNGVGLSISPNAAVGVIPYDYDFLPGGAGFPCWKLINIRF
jgi:hypothetical protein